MNKIVVFWFRRDLRFEDNCGLYHALNSGLQVLPIFIFDTNILNQLPEKNDKRVDLIHQILSDLNSKLQGYGSSLKILHGNPVEEIEKLIREYNIEAVYTNRDYESYARNRDKEVEQLLKSKGMNFYSFKDQVIFESGEVLKQDGKPYTIFTPYSVTWKKKLHEKAIENYSTENYFKSFIASTPKSLPAIEQLGYIPSGIKYNTPTINLSIISDYDTTRNYPALENGTSGLGVHLRFGTVSIRKLVGIALSYNETWLNELIWREFFKSILVHFPHVERFAFRKEYEEIHWRNNEDEFKHWCEGTTGYPLVDAGMRELNETGMMHNRVRMVVASFLCKHLLIDWRWGEAWFAQKLLDYDLSANNGNWQWAAGCGCDAAPYFRVFNPTEQTKKFDPEMKYIQKWVSNLTEFDYPQPIVDHRLAREKAIKIYREALKKEI